MEQSQYHGQPRLSQLTSIVQGHKVRDRQPEK